MNRILTAALIALTILPLAAIAQLKGNNSTGVTITSPNGAYTADVTKKGVSGSIGLAVQGLDGGVPVTITCPDGSCGGAIGVLTAQIDGGFLTVGLADGGILGGIASTVTVQGTIGVADGGFIIVEGRTPDGGAVPVQVDTDGTVAVFAPDGLTVGLADGGILGGIAGTVTTSPIATGCAGLALSNNVYKPISLTSSSGATIIQNDGGTNSIYICSLELAATGGAANIGIVTGTGTVCATNIAGLSGGTSAAAGVGFVAQGGLERGDGSHPIYKTPAGYDFCIVPSATTQVSGSVVGVYAP